MFGISKIFGFLISPDCGIHYPALITELRWKPVGFALLRLCAAIFVNRSASAADDLSRSTDPCFILIFP